MQKATLERLLEFCVHFRAPDQPFATGKVRRCIWEPIHNTCFMVKENESSAERTENCFNEARDVSIALQNSHPVYQWLYKPVTLERLLEFCVHFRAPDQPFATGKVRIIIYDECFMVTENICF